MVIVVVVIIIVMVVMQTNSWLDLHKDWEEMNITSVENGLMADIVNEKCSEMGRDFANRLEISPTQYFLFLRLGDALILFKFVFEYFAMKYLSLNSEPIAKVREKKRNRI
jgi:hypothetical protein